MQKMDSSFRLVTVSKRTKQPPRLSILLPDSQNPSLKQPQQERKKRQTQKYISKLVQQQPIKKICRFLKKNRGKNFPMNYSSQYNFVQKWQTSYKGAQISKMSVNPLSCFYPWMNFAVLPFLFVQIWLLSVYRVFQYQNCQLLFILGLLQQTLSLVYSCIRLFKIVDKHMDLLSQVFIALSDGEGLALVGNVYNIIYYALLITNISNIVSPLYLLPFDFFTIFFQYNRIEKIYSRIRIKAIGSKHKNFMHLFDLGSNVLILIHTFSVLLFLCTYYSPNNNWLTIAPFQIKQHWIFHYIYSFYFTCTTMLTVGYGDFHPTNQIQIMCILLVQLFGIVSNCYAISQIGVNLAQLRSSRDALQSDLSNAQKLAKFNAMPLQLRQEMREELVKNQQVNDELSLREEQGILDKLNDQLKEQIQVTNQISIVKTSLFILCHFGKRMQLQMSKRMIKVIYPPSTTLVQVFGKQKLFVLAKGTLDIMTQKRWKNRCFSQKLLKVMQKNSNNRHQVYRNVYGYSAMLSGKPSRLKATSKSFAVCYTLQHQDILDFIVGGEQDFQGYHSLKIKFHLTHLPQKIQVPEILSSLQHYSPNIFLLLYRYLTNRKNVNLRKWAFRRNLRCKLVIQKDQNDLHQKTGSVGDSNQSLEFQNIQISQGKGQRNKADQLMRNMLPLSDKSQLNLLSKPRVYANRDRNTKKYQELRLIRLQQKFPVFMKKEIYTESYHEYKRYLPHGNISRIIHKANKGKISECDFIESRLDILRNKQNLKYSKQSKY